MLHDDADFGYRYTHELFEMKWFLMETYLSRTITNANLLDAFGYVNCMADTTPKWSS
jgi:hypothetical protein